MLVTKTVPIEGIREAFELGVRDFGENRVQEFLAKLPELGSEIKWHFLGHLQTNKVKSIVGEVALVHSLDRLSLAEEIQKQAQKRNVTMDVLIQVNTTGNVKQSGFAPEKVEDVVGVIHESPLLNRIRIRGLMTIGPFTTDERAARESFQKLRNLREKLNQRFPQEAIHELSMGMSSDFEAAIEEGATLVRIGTAVFGERK